MQIWPHFINSVPIVGCKTVDEALSQLKASGGEFATA